MALSPAREAILSVSALTRLIKESLEGDFPAVWVRGEVSGCKRADSGHVYFGLREGKLALVDCVMWRTQAQRLRFEPRDGMEVEVFGGLAVYEPRGRYQLVAAEMRPAGIGKLLLAMEELKRRLGAEGLFDSARKRPLPRYPRRIGIVTSPVGAAVRDLVKGLRARWPPIEIVLAPTRVQGPGASLEIAAAIERFNVYGGVEILIVGRGGGSLEDLWAFNEEIVVRAIAASRIPVISAVGHEVDWTLSDLVADVRAATPSNAGELAVRERSETERQVRRLETRMAVATRGALDHRRRRLQQLLEKYGFRRQRDALGFLQQRIDDLMGRLRTSVDGLLRHARSRLGAMSQRYGLREWPRNLAVRRQRVADLSGGLTDAVVRVQQNRHARLLALAGRMRALSPRLVLERGYCLARRVDGSLIRSAEVLERGDRIALEFARGEADAVVEAVRPRGEEGG